MRKAVWKRVFIGVAAVVFLAAVIVPTVLMRNQDAAQAELSRQQALVLQFVQQYGTQAQLREVIEPERLHIFVWDGANADGIMYRHWSLQVGGLFVDLGGVELGSTE